MHNDFEGKKKSNAKNVTEPFSTLNISLICLVEDLIFFPQLKHKFAFNNQLVL